MYENRVSCGIVTDNGIVDIPGNSTGPIRPHSVKEILIRGRECLEQVAKIGETARDFLNPQDVRFLAPVPRPGKVLALAGNYAKHIKESGKTLGLSESPEETTVPRPFLMPSTVVTGTNSTVPWPAYSQEVDHEIELAVMIGKTARCVQADEALNYTAGYLIANDISARSVTFKEGRAERLWDGFHDWLNGKWSDGFLPLGPWLTTADEIDDPQNLDMTLTVNGQVRQQSNTSSMIYSVAEIISFISHLMTLEPGDVIATGTPHGVGLATGKYLQPGDMIDCTIERLGTLSNDIGHRPAEFYKPLAK